MLLGLGSVTMGIAQVAATKRRRGVARAMLVLTLFCALAFAYIALRGWSQANFHVDTNAYGTLYYVLTGTHLAHVLAGAVLLLALALFLGKRAFTRRPACRGRGDRVLLALRLRRLARGLRDDLPGAMTRARAGRRDPRRAGLRRRARRCTPTRRWLAGLGALAFLRRRRRRRRRARSSCARPDDAARAAPRARAVAPRAAAARRGDAAPRGVRPAVAGTLGAFALVGLVPRGRARPPAAPPGHRLDSAARAW